MARPLLLTPELQEALCGHLAQGAHVKTACESVGISERTYYDWKARGKKARDEPPPTLDLSRQGLIDLLAEADVTYPARATKTELLERLTLHREGSFLQFLQATTRAGAMRTLESCRIGLQLRRGGDGPRRQPPRRVASVCRRSVRVVLRVRPDRAALAAGIAWPDTN